MNQNDSDKLEVYVRASVDKFLANGGTLISKAFGYGKHCCPMRIAADASRVGHDALMDECISEQLNIPFSFKDLMSFAFGFDGQDITCSNNDPVAFALGKKLRSELPHTPKRWTDLQELDSEEF